MQAGIRMIDGKEYMLAGRTSDKERAQSEAQSLRRSWSSVRIIKIWEYDYMLYVHGRKENR